MLKNTHTKACIFHDFQIESNVNCSKLIPVRLPSSVSVPRASPSTAAARASTQQPATIQRPRHSRWVPGAIHWIHLLLIIGGWAPDSAPAQSTFTLRRDVRSLKQNDAAQDARIAHLEQDVSNLHMRMQSGSAPGAASGKSGRSVLPAAPQPSVTVPSVQRPQQGSVPQSSSAPVVHTVRKGETLWRIAMQHRSSPAEIMSANGMRSDQIREGQKLKIPGRAAPPPQVALSAPPPPPTAPAVAPQPTAPAPGASLRHTIAKGETLYQIGQRYGVSQAALVRANPGLNPDRIIAGSTLAIPVASSAAAPPQPAAVPSQTRAPSTTASGAPEQAPDAAVNAHVIASGDTFYSIARRHGISIDELRRANPGAREDRLQIGQRLKLPPSSARQVTAPVAPPPPPQPAEQPALRQPSTVQALPPATVATPAPAIKATPAEAPQKTLPGMSAAIENERGINAYRVHASDTIESIARQFNSTVSRLREINGLAPGEKLRTGDDILVPAMAPVEP
jgi:LysM repeat protein